MIATDTFLFVDLPKCGTTSVRMALRNDMRPDVPCNTGHWHTREIPEGLEHLPRFAVVRNPYARALSLYNFERAQVGVRGKTGLFSTALQFWHHWRLETFEGFMERCIENRDSVEYWLYLPCGLFLDDCEPVTALHLETLQADWDAQPLLPALALPHERAQDYARHMTPAQERLVECWAAEDFGRFGYEMRSQ